jgi:putative NADPH-quinone reductase
MIATRMRVQLVFAHPTAGSYTGLLAAAARRGLEKAGHTVVFTDLYREGFDPVLSAAERQHHYQGAYDSPAVVSYVNELRRAEGMVFAFPHWWFGMPAMLKGYFDRVWAPGIAFRHATRRGGVEPMLTELRKLWVVTTYGPNRWAIGFAMRDPTRRFFRAGLLRACARRADFRLLAHYGMDRTTQGSRLRFIARVEQALAKF